MSTKIYTAYSWSGSLYQLKQHLETVRKVYLEECKTAILFVFRNDPTRLKSHSTLFRKIDLAIKEELGLLNFVANVVVLVNKSKTVIIPFGLKALSNKTLATSKYIEDYCYFDNTDRPKSVTAKEWTLRKKFYDSVFKDSVDGCSSFSSVGFVMDLFNKEVQCSLCVNIALEAKADG